MASSHLKRTVAPKTWPIVRKTTKFIARPKPKGKLEQTLPAVVVLRDILGLVQNAAQARTVLRTQDVRVNGKRIHDTDSAITFMDVLTIGSSAYRLTINSNNVLTVIPSKDKTTIQRIAEKTSLKGGRIQLNCASGMNLLVEKDGYKPGDSIAVEDGKITAHYPFAQGAAALITGGTHIGVVGTIEGVEGQTVTIAAGDARFTTPKRNVYVVGKGKPAITLA